VGTVTIDLDAELRRLFGFAGFRPGQREAVEAALHGRDVLAIMPTGSGKSLCFQLPALVGGGVTLVVSPLIALMQDQFAALRDRGLQGVEMLASTMAPEQVAAALLRIQAGEAKLVYVAPERFSSRRFLEALAGAEVSRLVIDEAHCLSEWGHDFRPDYLRLADVRERLGEPPTMALTATATARVARDISRALRLRDPVEPRTGFDRPNLLFGVRRVSGEGQKMSALLGLLRGADALPAVVYCGRRATCESVSLSLYDAGLRAAPYHAGLPGHERTQTLERFLAGGLDVVAATTAFGMGIDKPDVRSVVHWALPASPEEYYQQAGRAGRDGLPAQCTLLYDGRDKGLIVFFINRAKLSEGELTGVHRMLAGAADERGIFRIAERELPVDDARAAVAVLERAGALEVFPAPSGTVTGRLADSSLSRAHLSAAMVAMKRVERMRWDRLKAIDSYATTSGCRRQALLGYFGETLEQRPADRCCDGHGRRSAVEPAQAEREAGPALSTTDAVLLAVDETAGRVGRTRIAQILAGSGAAALVAAGHDRLRSYGALRGSAQSTVLGAIDALIARGVLEQTAGHYPLVRRAAAAPAAVTARDADLRAQVVSLGEARDAAGVPFLLRVLAAHSSADVRRLAATSLGKIGDPSAEEGLVAALADEAPQVRQYAAVALGLLASEVVLPRLRELSTSDAEDYVRSAAGVASVRIRDRS
jgi:ATP-dependent DNA helicase RecQ